MNCTGTERQRAVIAAFKMRPEATQQAIATAAGVSLIYARHVLRDYLDSQARPPASVPASTKPTATMDVAVFQPDRRVGGNAGLASCTAKQQALRVALAEHPRQEGESLTRYCKRVGDAAKVSPGLVQRALDMAKCAAIGAAARAKEREEAANRCQVVPAGLGIGPVSNFLGWVDTFSRFQALASAYLNLADQRGDVYASAFLKGIREMAERAQNRAAMTRS